VAGYAPNYSQCQNCRIAEAIVLNLESLFDIAGRHIVVTGGASGIGEAIARGLATLGALVFSLDNVHEDMAPKKEGMGTLIQMHLDVSDEEQVRTVFRRITAEVSGVDALFSNAGISGKPIPFQSLTIQEWQRIHSVNLDGTFLVAREAVRIMEPARRGKLVFTNSVWGFVAASGVALSPYASSKGALVNLIRHLAVELAPLGITVNGIAPAGIRTRIADGFYDDPDAVELLRRSIPLGRIVEADTIIGTAAYLASSASDHMTGHTMVVDGGLLAQ
jgi:NAD(P)-dependent dehydrogenase (short-subunit alcohol dehydrogenase family)